MLYPGGIDCNRNANQRKKNEKPGHISNVTRKDILPETAKASK